MGVRPDCANCSHSGDAHVRENLDYRRGVEPCRACGCKSYWPDHPLQPPTTQTEQPDMDESRPQLCSNCNHLVSRHGLRGCDLCPCPMEFETLVAEALEVVSDAITANGHGPSHYTETGIQPWDVIEAYELDYFLGSVIKYVLRAGRKGIAPKVDDLKKARHYLDKAIEREERRSGG